MSPAEIAARPMSGPAWVAMKAKADTSCGIPNLANQDDDANVCVLAKALVFARTGVTSYRTSVIAALTSIASTTSYSGRALALGRELGAYAVAADLINLRTADPALHTRFSNTIRAALTVPTDGGPSDLTDCHEKRGNNWGTQCGWSRVAVAAYLDDEEELAQAAKVFKGWLGDRAAYSGFAWGDLDWQANPAAPVGINPQGATKQGCNIDGVLPDDQRRSGGFACPGAKGNYPYGALAGTIGTAQILSRMGYPDVWQWSNSAIRRAYEWLHVQNQNPAGGDDTWQIPLVNRIYGTKFPVSIPTQPGKNVGWTDWTHGN